MNLYSGDADVEATLLAWIEAMRHMQAIMTPEEISAWRREARRQLREAPNDTASRFHDGLV